MITRSANYDMKSSGVRTSRAVSSGTLPRMPGWRTCSASRRGWRAVNALSISARSYPEVGGAAWSLALLDHSPSVHVQIAHEPDIRDFSLPEYLAYLRRFERADERTRTAYPCSLRVITQALQGFAGGCKCRVFRGVSFLRLAQCCTVLRSQWYQSGIKIAFPSACTDGAP
jgi:hypothetical protein